MKSRRRQGIVCIGVGIVAASIGAVLLLSGAHVDSYEMFKAPLWVVGGVVLLVIGVSRLRAQSR